MLNPVILLVEVEEETFELKVHKVKEVFWKGCPRMSKLRTTPFLAGILPVNPTSGALRVCTTYFSTPKSFF